MASLLQDLLFFRELILDGRWEEAQLFVEPLRNSAFDHGRVNFYIDRQRFLELAEEQQSCPSGVKDLVSALKTLEGRCSQEEFHSLCYCLTLPSLAKHPALADWDVYRSRLACFESCLDHLKAVFPNQIPQGPYSEAVFGPRDPLLTLCEQALFHQMSEAQRQDPQATFPPEVIADLFSQSFSLSSIPTSNQSQPQQPPLPPGLAPSPSNSNNLSLSTPFPPPPNMVPTTTITTHSTSLPRPAVRHSGKATIQLLKPG